MQIGYCSQQDGIRKEILIPTNDVK